MVNTRAQKEQKTHRGVRGKEQMEKPGAHRGREPAGQSLGNTGEKPRELGSRREREKHRKYESEGKSLSKTTGNMKKPLTEVGEAAGGTGLGSQVPNGLLWDICSGKVEQSQVQSRRHDSGGDYYHILNSWNEKDHLWSEREGERPKD